MVKDYSENNLIEQPSIELFQSLGYTHQNCDESHHTQYDTLAMNMRTALLNAAFIAFTGAPLILGEELTRKTFGDYVSIYNFKQSIDDNATVPLYYENRIPEVQLKNEYLNEDIEQIWL